MFASVRPYPIAAIDGTVLRRQIFDVQVVLDMRHASPPRFMAAHANRFDLKRESTLPESFTRKPHEIPSGPLSVVAPIADKCGRGWFVRFVPAADNPTANGLEDRRVGP